MPREEEEDKTIYKVVVNHEEQYSIWFAEREPPLGWREVGKRGLKPDCLAYIKEVWTDMRPLSLRKHMEELAQGVRVDKNSTDLSQAYFDQRSGVAHLEGTLTLNYVKVRCVADIDLEALNGRGHLIVLEEAHA